MSTIRHVLAFSAIGLALLLAGCATLPETYPPPANPFLAGATPLASTMLAQPTKAGLVWLAPPGPAVPSQAAQQNLVDKIKARFAAGKRLEIVGATMIAGPQGDMLAEVRKASASFNVNHVLVVMPTGTEVVSPAWLHYGRNGRAVGTRTDSYVTVSLVGLDLNSGKSLYSVVATGEARLLAADYEDARPFFPRISPGRTSAFIYPDRATFPPGEVHAVALEQAVNGLIYELDRALGS
jgi:outer membrane protein TolC